MNKPKTHILLTVFLTALGGPSYSNTMTSSFYSESTWLAVIILSVVLLVIAALLYGIRRHLRELSEEKNPGSVEPTFYESTIEPVTKKWNPTIATLVIGGLIMAVLGGFGYKYGMDEVGVQQGYAPEQPINFSHKIHAGQYKIDCKYCHSTVEKSKSASIPPLNTCMNCHKVVKAEDKYDGETSPEIQKIYDAIGWDGKAYTRPQQPIKWVRIHNLPDLSYFNHSQHVVAGGVECQTCHGPIEEMERVYQFSTLQMGWCIDCHRERGIDYKEIRLTDKEKGALKEAHNIDVSSEILANPYYEHQFSDEVVVDPVTGKKRYFSTDSTSKGFISVADNGGLECAKCHY